MNVSVLVSAPPEQRFQLTDVGWDAYVAIGKALADRHIRQTYDRGLLELMTTSPEHARGKKLLARLIEALTEELDIEIAEYGSMTFQRADLKRGLEPDECFWIASEPRVRGKDPEVGVDPPPDLALEMEVSRSALDRMGIYAALGVPEVWRSDGTSIRVCLLTADGRYEEGERSRAFPFLRPAALLPFLRLAESEGWTTVVKSFRAWVREQVAAGWPNGDATP